MKTHKEMLEYLRGKIADGSWLTMSKEEIEQLEKLFNEIDEPKQPERGAGDDYPIIDMKP